MVCIFVSKVFLPLGKRSFCKMGTHDGFTMMGHPTIMAGAALIISSETGKFQGRMPATTPMGACSTTTLTSSLSIVVSSGTVHVARGR